MFKVGDRVHIDVDDEQWGRVASDATIAEVHPTYLLVLADSIRANIVIESDKGLYYGIYMMPALPPDSKTPVNG